MKNIRIEINLEVFETISDLPSSIQTLMNKAHEARENAYAPYSQFKVGAALQLDSGEIILGNNQENAAYPSGLCAERVAIFHASATHPNAIITSMAISARSLKNKVTSPVAPCGACRQVMVELAQRAMVWMDRGENPPLGEPCTELLPYCFSGSTIQRPSR